ncbi:exodeoxyribonuclease VII large subunit [Gordonia phage BrutonGaster]|uniref:Exodeoxyribonuclease VII large subunit n=1 Tax=Gordonia phage BrutonGaster TaxID=2530116 RepID=A0A482JLK1_9CAUD|nr:exonuclease [Gordonia phage BrutonGaster]QBP33269.1 exodeoxyribonuclease VII large subunit [Gordonia phage BrutonGaster]
MAGKPTEDKPWPVAVYNREVGGYIGRLGDIWVEGQLTRVHRPSGSVTFIEMRDTEKNQSISVTASPGVVPADIASGDHVKVLGHPQYWTSRGTLSLRISRILPVGEGALQAEMVETEKRLESEGLFHPRHKQRLPAVPKLIGLITAENSDAEKDVLNVARDRWPNVEFKTLHIPVQGVRCAGRAVAALKSLDADPTVDVIIFARGGGSNQDLLPWSDEALARAVFAANTPTVSAIGHENDKPMLDRVVDLRAATPTDAAKRVVPNLSNELRQIEQVFEQIGGSIRGQVQNNQLRVDSMLNQVAGSIAGSVNREQIHLQNAVQSLFVQSEAFIGSRERRVDTLGETLKALDHQKVLDRGYAVVQGVTGPTPASGTRFTVTTKDGTFDAVVA